MNLETIVVVIAYMKNVCARLMQELLYVVSSKDLLNINTFFFSLGLSHEGQIEFCNVYFISTALKYIAIFYNDYIPA